MVKKVILTFQSNFVVAVLNLLITIVTAKYLGAAGKGYLSIVAVYIMLIQLLNDTCGASVVFYLLKKFKAIEIIFISYSWFFIVSAVSTFLIFGFELLKNDIFQVFYLNVLISSCYLLNIKIIINKIGIKWHNILVIMQPLLTVILIYINGFDNLAIKSFLTFQVISFTACLIISFFVLRKELSEKLRYHRLVIIITESFKMGFLNQSASLSQMINYRFSYFYLEKFSGLKAVGVFSIILSVANVIWLFASTIGTLLGVETSNAKKISVNLLDKYITYVVITILLTLPAIIAIYLLPSSVFINILNKDFGSLRQLLFYMTPGIVIFSISKVLAFFFSSSGDIQVNFYASFVAVIPSIVLGYILIKNYGIYGAIISSSISFSFGTAILIFFFFKERNRIKKLSD